MTTTDTRTLSSYFETRTRDDGTRFVTLTDDRPEWLHDAVMAAHDDEMPNDWRYETCRAIAEWIDEATENENLADVIGWEIGDSLTDVYNSDLIAWLGGNLGRIAACDEAFEEIGADSDDGLIARISLGQSWTIARMADVLLEAAREAAEADDDTDEEG